MPDLRKGAINIFIPEEALTWMISSFNYKHVDKLEFKAWCYLDTFKYRIKLNFDPHANYYKSIEANLDLLVYI